MTHRRRLFLLLAGFFGFVTSTAVSAMPGTAVADVVTNSAAAQSEAPTSAVEAPRPTDVPRPGGGEIAKAGTEAARASVEGVQGKADTARGGSEAVAGHAGGSVGAKQGSACQTSQQAVAAQAVAVVAQAARAVPARGSLVIPAARAAAVVLKGVDPAVVPGRGPPLHTDTQVPVN